MLKYEQMIQHIKECRDVKNIETLNVPIKEEKVAEEEKEPETLIIDSKDAVLRKRKYMLEKFS